MIMWFAGYGTWDLTQLGKCSAIETHPTPIKTGDYLLDYSTWTTALV